MKPYVIIIKNNLIEEIIACENGQHVEKVFIDKCSQYLSNFEDYNEDDKSCVLEDGYVKVKNGAIQIEWF